MQPALTTPPSFRLVVHQDARGWQPTGDALARLRTLAGDPRFVLRYWPHSMAWDVTHKNVEPHAFRARKVDIDRAPPGPSARDEYSADIFVDETETPASIAWLSAHELAHMLVAVSPVFRQAFQDSRPLDLDPLSDEFHMVDAEERFCDGLATRLMGQRYDRAWWRQRVRQSQARTGSKIP